MNVSTNRTETAAQYDAVEQYNHGAAPLAPPGMHADGHWHPVAEITGDPVPSEPVAPTSPVTDAGFDGAGWGALGAGVAGAAGGAAGMRWGSLHGRGAVGIALGAAAAGAIIGFLADREGGQPLAEHPARYLASVPGPDNQGRPVVRVRTEHSTLPADVAARGELEAEAAARRKERDALIHEEQVTSKKTVPADDPAPAAPVAEPPVDPSALPDDENATLTTAQAKRALEKGLAVHGTDPKGTHWTVTPFRGSYLVKSEFGPIYRDRTSSKKPDDVLTYMQHHGVHDLRR